MTTTINTLTARAAREQGAFRALLDAMARPGTIKTLPRHDHGGAHAGAISALEALVDHEVTFAVWPEHAGLTDIVLRQTGSRVAALHYADYVLCDPERLAEALGIVKDGTLEYPDRGATLLCRVESLSNDTPAALHLQLSGPGIRDTTTLYVEGLPEEAIEALRQRNSMPPLGIDLVLVTPGGQACCLTRYTRIAR